MPGGIGFNATQELATARVNFTVGSDTAGILSASTIIARDENVLLARIHFDRSVTANMTLSTPNVYDLPVTPAATTNALTLARKANAWIVNAAVLSECDPDILRYNTPSPLADSTLTLVCFLVTLQPTLRLEYSLYHIF